MIDDYDQSSLRKELKASDEIVKIELKEEFRICPMPPTDSFFARPGFQN